MKNIIKLTSIVLILLILASCAPAVEPTGTGATTGTTNTATSTETIEYTPEELLYNTIYDEYRDMYYNLFVDAREDAWPWNLKEPIIYYLENFAPEIYEQYANKMLNIQSSNYSYNPDVNYPIKNYPSSQEELNSTYTVVNYFEIPRWLTREYLANFIYGKYTGRLLNDLVDALYTCKTEAEFHAFFDKFYEPIKEHYLNKKFIVSLQNGIYDYLIKNRLNNKTESQTSYQLFEEWLDSRGPRHSEILEKYMGMTPEWLERYYHIHLYANYMMHTLTLQVSIAEYIDEFDITHEEFDDIYIPLRVAFKNTYSGESAPNYRYSETRRTNVENLIKGATTPHDTTCIDFLVIEYSNRQ